MSETTKLSALRDDDPYCRYCGIGCCDHVRAQLAEVTRELTAERHARGFIRRLCARVLHRPFHGDDQL